MAKFDIIRRSGSASSPKRFIVGIVLDGKGKEESRVTFSTPIIKVAGPEKFRQGGGKIPIEQYAFQVGATTFERFGDAAASVLRRHHASLKNPADESLQEYVKLACRILDGSVQPRIIKQPEDFAPAAKEIAA